MPRRNRRVFPELSKLSKPPKPVYYRPPKTASLPQKRDLAKTIYSRKCLNSSISRTLTLEDTSFWVELRGLEGLEGSGGSGGLVRKRAPNGPSSLGEGRSVSRGKEPLRLGERGVCVSGRGNASLAEA